MLFICIYNTMEQNLNASVRFFLAIQNNMGEIVAVFFLGRPKFTRTKEVEKLS